jgi:hypothetical protein
MSSPGPSFDRNWNWAVSGEDDSEIAAKTSTRFSNDNILPSFNERSTDGKVAQSLMSAVDNRAYNFQYVQ